jgi:vitamin B12 transporter
MNVYVQKMFSQDWTSRLDLSRNRIALKFNFATTNPTTVLNDYRLSNTVKLNARRSLRFGLDRREETRSPAANSLASRDFTSPYIGYLLSAGRWSGQLNARYDSASVGASKGTWLVGAGYQLSNELRATASASTAFRFPDSFALSLNSSLVPESHESREVGLVYETALTSLRATIFMSETKDPITFNSPNFTVAQNANFMKNKGLELFGGVLLSSKTKMKVGFVAQYPESPFATSSTTAIRVQSARRAKVHGSVGVTHSLGSTELAATVQGASRRRDSDSDPVGIYSLPGYAMLNLRGQVKISKELSLSARLDNALDKQYELAYGYNTAPRTLFIGLQFQPAL